MAAYVIVDIEVLEPKEYEDYKKLSTAALAAFDGEFIARGGNTEVLEGEWQPNRLVMLKFESAARAREWWESAEYAPARAIRERTARTNMVLVEGA